MNEVLTKESKFNERVEEEIENRLKQVERIRLEIDFKNVDFANIENALLHLERELLKVVESNNVVWKGYIIDYPLRMLESWFEIFEQEGNKQLNSHVLAYHIEALGNQVTKVKEERDFLSLIKRLMEITPNNRDFMNNRYIDFKDNEKSKLRTDSSGVFEVMYKNYNSNSFNIDYGFKNEDVKIEIHTILRRNYEARKSKLVSTWEVKIYFKDDRILADVSTYFMFLFTSLATSIPGVEAEIVDWGKGSLWTKIKLWFLNGKAEQETKEILEKGRRALEAKYLEQPALEVEKAKAEKELLDKQIDASLTKEQVERKKELELNKLELENQEKELLLEKIALENMKAKFELIEKANNLMELGIVNIDNLVIEMNGKLFLEKGKGRIEKGEEMDVISKNGKQEDKKLHPTLHSRQ